MEDGRARRARAHTRRMTAGRASRSPTRNPSEQVAIRLFPGRIAARFFAESVLVRDDKELAEPLASLKTLQPGLTWGFWADVRLVHAVRLCSRNYDKQELVPPRMRASLRAMGFGEWDDERLTAAIKAANHRSWEKKPPVTFQNPWNIRFLRMPPSWPVVIWRPRSSRHGPGPEDLATGARGPSRTAITRRRTAPPAPDGAPYCTHCAGR